MWKWIISTLYILQVGLYAGQAAPTEEVRPVVILGSGVAALTSAVYLARGGIIPLVITGPTVGGAITQSYSVQNWPGELDITGLELSERIKTQALQNGAIFQEAEVVAVDFSTRPFKIEIKPLFSSEEATQVIQANSCIIALGSAPNRLEVKGEEQYGSKGVYSCAVCDGSLYKDKVVAVVGGGDSALTEAHYLSRIAKKVYVMMRKEQFRSIEPERVLELAKLPNVEIIRQVEVVEIQGDGQQVTQVLVRHMIDQQITTHPVDAVFLAIGATPNTQLFEQQLALDSRRYIVVKNQQETSVPGVYAVGDITPGVKQAISAAGDAAKAALQAHEFIAALPAVVQEVPSKTEGVVTEIRSVEELKQLLSKGPVVLDFYGDYCPPCRAFGPVYEKWAKQWGNRLHFAKVNATLAPDLFRLYQVQAIPTLILFDGNGQLVRRSTGSQEISGLTKEFDRVAKSS